MERDGRKERKMRGLKHFNSHAHVERDLYSNGCYSSIAYFNSHAHVGRDMKYHLLEYCKKHFNSHAHVERDLPSFSHSFSLKNFNSHAHVERDVKQRALVTVGLISTHTLTWSVTIRLPLTSGRTKSGRVQCA